MKKIVSIVLALVIGVAVLSPSQTASAQPVGNGLGNQVFHSSRSELVLGSTSTSPSRIWLFFAMLLALIQIMFIE